ncbi:hypothetical protein FNV43_RR21835 [Rhamnella rubrinervis]|uniref:Uncharacterized protein n=1 Tax=Rhamnella rubrinervis TaxID=2594499 RepID=A0A8K0DPB5_9ROSA|nr:hypothetical protein FNV43_RR21835 [Rhamnella rubrinervis]
MLSRTPVEPAKAGLARRTSKVTSRGKEHAGRGRSDGSGGRTSVAGESGARSKKFKSVESVGILFHSDASSREKVVKTSGRKSRTKTTVRASGFGSAEGRANGRPRLEIQNGERILRRDEFDGPPGLQNLGWRFPDPLLEKIGIDPRRSDGATSVGSDGNESSEGESSSMRVKA